MTFSYSTPMILSKPEVVERYQGRPRKLGRLEDIWVFSHAELEDSMGSS
jgi:hypothetical protein